MKTILQVVIGIVVVVLGYLLYDSMMQPVRFNDSVSHRKALVVERLKNIRTLQEYYKGEYGKYTGSFDTLINFYKNGNISIVRQIGSLDDSLAVAKKLIKRDTVRIPARDSLFKNLANFNVDSLRVVPVVGDQFDLQAKVFITISKVEIPLFEASVTNDVYLRGLDRQSIVNMNDAQTKMAKFPGVKVGSVESPNNNAGNWE